MGAFGPTATVTGPTPQQIPQVAAPNPTSRGFMPISSAGVQRPGMSPMQPPSPQTAPVQNPVTPAAPPPTVQTADTSNVPGRLTSVPIRHLPLICLLFSSKKLNGIHYLRLLPDCILILATGE